MEPGKKLKEYVSSYCIFDLETTGISHKKDKIIEISAIKVKDGEVIEEFSTLVNPGMHIPYYATEVNGITDSMVKDAPEIKDALSDFVDFIENYVLIGHNIQCFDMKFIYREMKDCFGDIIANDYIDTLPMARQALPNLAHHTLVDLAEHYGLSSEGAHRALNDCRMNQIVYENLREDIERQYENTPKEMRCPLCSRPLKIRNGKFGEFIGCTGYPTCRYTRNV